MKVSNNAIVNAPKKKQPFALVITGAEAKGMIMKSLNDPKRAADFTSTLISVVEANEKLAACKPMSLIAAALKGEGMGLSLPLAQYSIVPYGDLAQFQISYKGMAQLATRSGQYRDFGVFDVREGEYKGKDMRTRQPVIEWMEDEDEREKLPLAGFYGFYELKNGFFKAIYWSHEKILTHADRYSKAFDKSKYDKILDGTMDKADMMKLRSGSPWYDEPLSEAHMKMCKKTLLLQMLGDGTAPLSIVMQSVIDSENASAGNAVIDADDPLIKEAERNRRGFNAETGEIEPEAVVDVEAKVVD